MIVHGAKAASLPKDFKPSLHPGLMFCHHVATPAGRILVSYWQSRESFQTYGGPFLTDLTDGLGPSFEGSFAHYSRKRESLWKRFPFWTVVITASALIGAFAALWQAGAQLFEAPDVTVAFKTDNPPNVLATTVPALAYSVTNQCRYAPAAVDIRSAIVPSATKDDAVKFPPDVEDRLSRIEAGKLQDFSIRQPPPQVPASEGPVAYQLRLLIVSKAGLWRWARTFRFPSPTFLFWTFASKLAV